MRISILAAAACLVSLSAVAQGNPPAASGLSPGPASPMGGSRAGVIAPTGQTKPPGAPVGDRAGTTPDLDRKSRELDRQISKGICKGC